MYRIVDRVANVLVDGLGAVCEVIPTVAGAQRHACHELRPGGQIGSPPIYLTAILDHLNRTSRSVKGALNVLPVRVVHVTLEFEPAIEQLLLGPDFIGP